jgi:hypothetical protein
MIAPLALLCAAVVLGIVAGSYTRRRLVRTPLGSVDCIDAEVTTTVRFVLGVASFVCFIGAARGFL